jgi:hypothetical protein
MSRQGTGLSAGTEARNARFAAGGSDPIAQVSGGSADCRVLVPDTGTTPICEPLWRF